ncbi:MAG: PolC-type DNA polymerase III [Bacilli bacterium]|nr:PolC-type DNA polymerase III [Bacilli bacterium]
MDDKFLLLLETLDLLEEKEHFDGKINEMYVNKADDSWFFDIEFKKPLDIEDFDLFTKRIELLPKKIKSIQKIVYHISYVQEDNQCLEDYYTFVLKKLAKKKPRFSSIIDFDIDCYNNRIEVLCPKDGTFVSDLLSELKIELTNIGFDAYLTTRMCNDTQTIEETIEQQSQVFENVVMQTSEITDEENSFIGVGNNVVRKINNTIKDIPKTEEDLITLKSLNEKANFTFEGEVVAVDYRNLGGTTDLFTFIVSDEDDSIYVKKFVKDKEEVKFLNGTKPGMGIRVSGIASFDKFSDEVTITAIVLERTKFVNVKDHRKDLEVDKRIEFHVHTKMSTLDGITSITDYVDTAKRWGHKAIALTDHGNVQAFPDFYKATKDKSIKPIFGCEFTFINHEDLDIVKHPIDLAFDDAIYTVFDIETTGLSVNFDKVIEIAAVRIQHNQIISEYQTYVNPEIPISELTTKITSIKNSDVALAPKIAEVIPEFKAFFEGTVMVAHNAHFDMGFIYEILKEYNLFDGPIPTVDTLQIARSCYGEDLKRFNLKAVARHFKVDLVQHHRAIYDTRATADIFLHMLRDARKQGVFNVNELNRLSNKSDAYKYSISKHINLLVQNQVGLRNLYKIVSIANTDHFYKEARLKKEVLDKNRQGLLVGSGCMNSDFFETALNKSYDELLEKAKYFDYLEIQPLSDFEHFNEDMIDAYDRVASTMQRIVAVGKELDIPVIATGDVHHLLKNEKKYRDIYVQTPVVGGGIHPLSRYNDIPSQYLRTTSEMLEEFKWLGEELSFELVVKNPNKLNEKIEFVQAFKPELYAPTDDFLALDGIPSIENKLIKMVSDRSKELYGRNVPQLVQDRINKEIKSITENKFSTVYYISHLLVKKSLDEGYLVGSRGSVGSSFVATLMNITEVNPLPPHYVCPKCFFSSFKMTTNEKTKYGITTDELALQSILDKVDSGFDLPNATCPKCSHELRKDGHSIPFETFLGFKGDKVPDIDLNFSGDYQPIVHEYIREIFGKDRAFRAGTISTVADRTAFGYVRGYLERKNLTMRKAEIERIASNITGVKRSTGQHPGGIVVVPNYKEIIDVTPVQFPADDTTSVWRTTHFDYHSFEDNLFKLDVLGHDDPTMIRYLMDYVKSHSIDFPFSEATEIPMDDPEVYKLLNSTEIIGLKKEDVNSEVASFGIPEMGTNFVRGMLRDSRPQTFADIVKISGLSHGTDVWRNNAESLVLGSNAKYGKIPFKEVIGCRDDIMVYLIENGMKNDIAFEIAEFIRKGKPSKDIDAWEGYKLIMREQKIPEWYIWSCGKIKYMFPKAHATAYVMMALRIAWFKLYKPILFYSAYFSKRASDFDVYAFTGGEYEIMKKMNEIEEKGNRATETEKRLYTVLEVANEMIKRGFTFKPIDINKSDARDFIIDADNKSLILPFITVDGLGLKVAQSIVDARLESEFKSKDDVKERTSISKTLFTKFEMLDVFKDLPDNSQMNLFDF